MPGKSNNYTLGEFGVNRVKSPVHLIDGELLAAQNAEVGFVQGNRGLRKRGGLRKITTASAAAGAILSMSLIPLSDPNPGIEVYPPETAGDLYVPFATGGGWRTSTDGTAWATTATPATVRNPIIPSLLGRFYYADVSNNLLSWDGATQRTHGVLRGAPFASACARTLDSLYVLTTGGLDVYSTVSDTIAPAGQTILSPGCLAVAGVVVAGASTTGLGAVSRLYRLSAGAWVLEHAIPGSGGSHQHPESMAAFSMTGRIYCATRTEDVLTFGFTGEIFERTGTGSWSSVETSATRIFSDLVECDGALYVLAQASNPNCEVLRSTDGVTWATDEDIAAAFGSDSYTALIAWGDQLFLLGSSRILRRDNLGVWSVVDSGNVTNPASLGYL